MLRRTVTLVSIAAVLLAGIAWSAQAFNPQPDIPLDYGLIGITATDVARFSVVSIDTPDLIDNPELRCGVVVTFLDAEGATLLSEEHQLRAGQGRSVDFRAADAGLRTGRQERLSLRPTYALAERNECTLLPTLEILDARTMATRFVHPAARVAWNPQPDPPIN
jgi:hypothetical protein